MAQPVAQGPVQAVTQTVFTANGFGQIASNTEYQLAPYPISNPTILLGKDCVPFTTDGANVATVTFQALPIRQNQINPIQPAQASGNSLTIRPQDTLIFTAYAMQNGVHCQVGTVVIDTNNVRYKGQILSAGTYVTFQATVYSTTPTSGIIVGELALQRG